MTERVELLLHGKGCSGWREPDSLKGWEALKLIEGPEVEGWHLWICPVCEQVVIQVYDGGELDFGTMRDELIAHEVDGSVRFETFEPLAEPGSLAHGLSIPLPEQKP